MQLEIQTYENGFIIKSMTKKFGRTLHEYQYHKGIELDAKDVLELIALLEEALTIDENGFEIITNAFKEHATGLYIGCCPFHEEITPSCVYYPKNDTFHCFGCGKKGETQELAAALLNAKETKE